MLIALYSFEAIVSASMILTPSSLPAWAATDLAANAKKLKG
jgi:hypothetical protein